MTYDEALGYIHKRGTSSDGRGLERTRSLLAALGNPQKKTRFVHVAGTNGKGSCSSMIAATLQAQGYRTALYTSPHLVDFRERIRVNGEMIPEQEVVSFVERFKASGYEGHPSFFELTMMMAFDWFARAEVDYAVIEVGMGGRLDSTNIITPLACVITNISPDHTQFLGSTLPAIASEKAGIIKAGIPVTIGEAEGDVRAVFERKATEQHAPVIFAQDNPQLLEATPCAEGGFDCETRSFGQLHCELSGQYQRANINTVLTAVGMMREAGIAISDDAVRKGLAEVGALTGFRGRWTVLSRDPLTICDTGHNEAGLRYNIAQLRSLMADRPGATLRIVLGFVADKDVDHILGMLPREARYYFCNAAIPRALPADELARRARAAGLTGTLHGSVRQAYQAARLAAELSTPASPLDKMHQPGVQKIDDIIYVGGSTFVVADLLAAL